FQAEDGIRDFHVTGVQTCALPIYHGDAVAAQAAHLPFVQAEQILAVVVNATGRVAGDRVGQQAQDGVSGDGLAGAAFADQGQGRSEERRVGKAGRWGGSSSDQREE